MAHLQLLYSEWLDQDVGWQDPDKESPPPKSLAWLLLGFGGNLTPIILCQFSLHQIETRQIK